MQHQPDCENLRRTLLPQGPPGPVPFFELMADPGMVEAVLGEKFSVNLHRLIEEPTIDLPEDQLPGLLKSMEMYVRFCHEVGYDYVFMASGFNLPTRLAPAADTAEVQNFPGGQRYWQEQGGGPIQSWKDFEAYPWPKADELRHPALEYVSQIVPEGMKVAAFNHGGVFEKSTWLMGMESFSFALNDQPDLVEAICQRVGELVTATGNSDSHSAYGTEVGYPRNYVKLSTDDPAKVSLTEFAKSIKDQQVLVSGGPFVTVQAGGKSMGEVAKVTGGTIALEVKVQAPTWMSADTLRVIVGGTEVKTVTLDSSTADPTNPVVRYDSSVDLSVSADTWVVVVVTGSTSMDPVVRGDKPFAVTNPIYLDVDGNGAYDAPKSF